MKVSIAAVVAIAAAHAPILLYARSAGSDVNVGTLTIDGRSVIVDKADAPGADKACVGTKDLPDHQCFGYTDLASDWGVDVFLDEQADIARLLVRQGAGRVHKYREDPQPNLKAWAVVNHPARGQANNEKSQEKKGPHTEVKITKKKVVEEDEHGNKVEREVEVEEEVLVDNRLFVQKYWVYLVIPLVMMLLQKDPQNQRRKQD